MRRYLGLISHQLGDPETFFTPHHVVPYSGVGIGFISAIIAIFTLLKNKELLKRKLQSNPRFKESINCRIS